jgi:hypothetical protein
MGGWCSSRPAKWDAVTYDSLDSSCRNTHTQHKPRPRSVPTCTYTAPDAPAHTGAHAFVNCSADASLHTHPHARAGKGQEDGFRECTCVSGGGGKGRGLAPCAWTRRGAGWVGVGTGAMAHAELPNSTCPTVGGPQRRNTARPSECVLGPNTRGGGGTATHAVYCTRSAERSRTRGPGTAAKSPNTRCDKQPTNTS